MNSSGLFLSHIRIVKTPARDLVDIKSNTGSDVCLLVMVKTFTSR